MFTIHNIYKSYFLLSLMLLTPLFPSQTTHIEGKKLMNFSSNNQALYHTVEAELKALKSSFSELTSIPLFSDKAQALAPTLYKNLHGTIKKLTNKKKMDMPSLEICTKETSKTYGASVHSSKQTTVITTTYSDGSTHKDITEKNTHTITLGEELIKICFWQKEHMSYLSAAIAHELGHIHHGHFHKDSCPSQELEADTFAAHLLDNASDLENTLDVINLACHIFTTIEQIAPSLCKQDTFAIVRKLASKVVLTTTELGILGTCKSDSTFFKLIKTCVSQTLSEKCSQKDFTDNQAKVLTAMYRKIKTACDTTERNISHKFTALDHKYLRAENKAIQSGIISNPTHPDQVTRRKNLKQA